MAAPARGLPIRTRSLLLRQFVPQDARTVLVLSREEASRTWLPSQVLPDPASAASVLEHLIASYTTPADPRRGPYVLAVEHLVDRAVIGHVGFSPYDADVEIGFAIGEAFQRRGLAAEAIVAACRWALGTFGLRRILAIASVANEASRRTLRRTAFAHQRDEVMRFQGTEQRVGIYVLSADHEPG